MKFNVFLKFLCKRFLHLW